MGSTGLYSKGIAKRDEILNAALEIFAEGGYRGTSLREVARRVNLSLTGVMYHFDSKEQLLTDVMRKRQEVDVAVWNRPDLDPVERLVSIMTHNASVPGLIELYATLMAAASDPDHPAHDYMAQRLVAAREQVEHGIRELQRDERVPLTVDPTTAAFSIVAATEGIQLHWLLDRSIDMGARVRDACAPYLISPRA